MGAALQDQISEVALAVEQLTSMALASAKATERIESKLNDLVRTRPPSSSNSAGSPDAPWTSANVVRQAADLTETESAKQSTISKENFMAKHATEELFGRRSSMIEESIILRQQRRAKRARCPRLVLMPNTGFRFWWDMASTSLVVFISLTLPYRLAFVLEWSLFFTIIDLLIDIFFFVDLPINFITAFYRDHVRAPPLRSRRTSHLHCTPRLPPSPPPSKADHVRTTCGSTHQLRHRARTRPRVLYAFGQVLITSYRQIALKYLRTWFVPDVISSVPVDWLLGSDGLPSFVDPNPNITSTADAVLGFSAVFRVAKVLRHKLRAAVQRRRTARRRPTAHNSLGPARDASPRSRMHSRKAAATRRASPRCSSCCGCCGLRASCASSTISRTAQRSSRTAASAS